MPYSRELTVPLGVINDTFETAVTWDKFEDFHTAVAAATAEAIKEATGSAGTVSTRFTHVYPETRHLRSRPARSFKIRGVKLDRLWCECDRAYRTLLVHF